MVRWITRYKGEFLEYSRLQIIKRLNRFRGFSPKGPASAVWNFVSVELENLHDLIKHTDIYMKRTRRTKLVIDNISMEQVRDLTTLVAK
jgi:hypothetical protein